MPIRSQQETDFDKAGQRLKRTPTMMTTLSKDTLSPTTSSWQ